MLIRPLKTPSMLISAHPTYGWLDVPSRLFKFEISKLNVGVSGPDYKFRLIIRLFRDIRKWRRTGEIFTTFNLATLKYYSGDS